MQACRKDTIDEATAHVTDQELLARMSDVVWVKLKRHEAARRAIDAYLNAARDSRFMERVRFERLERAFRLAKQLNARDKWQECEKLFAIFKETPALFNALSLNLFSLAQTFQILDPAAMAEEARAMASNTIGQNPFLAESLLLIAAAGFKQASDEASAADCNRMAANGFLAIADKADALTGIHFIECAVEALRRAGASRAEILKLNTLLTAKGKESLSQMKRIEGASVDFSHTVNAAKKLVQGVPPNEALKKLAFQFPVLSYAEHKEKVEQSIKKHPLMHFIEAKTISSEGRQYSRRPSFMSDDPKEQKLALESEVAHSMAIHQQAVTKFGLIPALSEIGWTTKDFNELFNIISYRPIVPQGRAQIYFAGIRAGLEGEFVYAAHVLIPQLENSLRFLLEVRGLSVVTIDKDGIHSEMSLNAIFENYRRELIALFGSEDLVYSMEAFLCSRAGDNFRNEIAHGLVENVLDYRLAFAWWLSVYLLFLLKFPDSAPRGEDKA